MKRLIKFLYRNDDEIMILLMGAVLLSLLLMQFVLSGIFCALTVLFVIMRFTFFVGRKEKNQKNQLVYL
jgi:membrane protein implicated in regulation of membrane protease activity